MRKKCKQEGKRKWLQYLPELTRVGLMLMQINELLLENS